MKSKRVEFGDHVRLDQLPPGFLAFRYELRELLKRHNIRISMCAVVKDDKFFCDATSEKTERTSSELETFAMKVTLYAYDLHERIVAALKKQ